MIALPPIFKCFMSTLAAGEDTGLKSCLCAALCHGTRHHLLYKACSGIWAHLEQCSCVAAPPSSQYELLLSLDAAQRDSSSKTTRFWVGITCTAERRLLDGLRSLPGKWEESTELIYTSLWFGPQFSLGMKLNKILISRNLSEKGRKADGKVAKHYKDSSCEC